MFLELTDNIILKDCFETVGKIIDDITNIEEERK